MNEHKRNRAARVAGACGVRQRLVLLAAVCAVASNGCTNGTGAVTVRNGPALDPPPAPHLAPPSVRALHFGDFGDRTRQQQVVARAIGDAHRRAPFDLAVVAGDLIYPCGPDATYPGAAGCKFAPDSNTVAPGFVAPADPSFRVHEEPLEFLGETPVYLALGNHDVTACGATGGVREIQRLKACLNIAHASPQWILPARHYVIDHGPARFIVIDSNLIVAAYGGFSLDDEVAFVAAQAAGCEERFCFLVGHHPPATAGGHRRDEYFPRFKRVLQAGQGRIRAYLGGHAHDLQHLHADGIDVFISGAAARPGADEYFEVGSKPGVEVLFGTVLWGYAVVEVSADGWRYRFEDERSRPLYCCTAVGAGRCEPTACAVSSRNGT